MIQITTLHHLHLWIEPIDFRKGIDALIGLCRQNTCSPYDGTIPLFATKAAWLSNFWFMTARAFSHMGLFHFEPHCIKPIVHSLQRPRCLKFYKTWMIF